MTRNNCQLMVLLLFMAANASAQDDYGYSLIRIVREQSGEPSKPTIVLPKPFALHTAKNFEWASRAEYYVYVTGPKREAKDVVIRWPGVKVAQVIVGDDRLPLRREGDTVLVDIPVRHGRLANLKRVAHDAWNTLEVWSFHHEKNLKIQVPHNDPDRAAGFYAKQTWGVQAQSALNFVFAGREVIRDWKLHHELAAEEESFVELMGFETNNPLHGDAPAHWHLSIFWPDKRQTRTAVMCIPHFYMDSAGRVTSNGFSTYGPPSNGEQSKWHQSTLGPGEPALYKDRSGKVRMAITIRKDGGVDLGPDAKTVAYSILPKKNGALVVRREQPWRLVQVDDDVKKGVMTVTVISQASGNEKPRIEVNRYDPLTGVERKQKLPIPVAHRGLLRHAPENTLPAFAACLELGMGFELDIRTTKDGHLVVLHDDNVQRTTNGPARSVRDMTLAELKKLDAGSWFDSAFAGVRIPTLEETLSLVAKRKRGRTIIALNVKHLTREGESKLIALVEKYKLLNESFAFDQSDEMSHRLKKLNPAFRIGQNVNRQDIDARLEEGLVDCFLLTSTPTADEVSRLHRRGKQVLFNYGGSGEARRSHTAWKQTAEAGTDGLLTDYPLECRAVWREAAVQNK